MKSFGMNLQCVLCFINLLKDYPITGENPKLASTENFRLLRPAAIFSKFMQLFIMIQTSRGGNSETRNPIVSIPRHPLSHPTMQRLSFDFNVAYSSRWGYSLMNTLKLKKTVTLGMTGYHRVERGRGGRCYWSRREEQQTAVDVVSMQNVGCWNDNHSRGNSTQQGRDESTLLLRRRKQRWRALAGKYCFDTMILSVTLNHLIWMDASQEEQVEFQGLLSGLLSDIPVSDVRDFFGLFLWHAHTFSLYFLCQSLPLCLSSSPPPLKRR